MSVARQLDVGSVPQVDPRVLQGVAHQRGGRLDAAEQLYKEVLGGDPGHVEALQLLGALRMRQHRYVDALTLLEHALQLRPHHGVALRNRAGVLRSLGRQSEALEAIELALRTEPRHVPALLVRAQLLAELGRHEAARVASDNVLAIEPANTEALYGKAVMLLVLDRHAEAVACFDAVLALQPALAPAMAHKARALASLGRWQESRRLYESAIATDPADSPWYEMYFDTLRSACDWERHDELQSLVLARVQEAAAAAMPLLLLNLHSSREEQRLCARKMSRKVAADVAALPPAPRITSPQRLRVAYLSANFNAHPVAHAVARLFEEHDRSGFEVIGVSMGAEDGSAIGRRVRAAMDGWRDICALSDTDAASLLRDLGIDLAVDLMGHTESFRPRVLAARPAPVQVSFLGYPGTLGAPWIDYLIADRFVLPPEHVASYDEKVVWLPGCFLPGDAWQPPGTAPDRRELGLPTQGVVYGCFNTHRKITPDVFDQWMQVLRAVPDGVLWLREAGEEPCANLRREAQRRGIDAQRLHFAPFVPDALHRARIAAMDVFLDTYPYTAHSTVREVLSAGVPLLTRTGDTFPSRVAGSMLHAAGFGQLVAGSPTEYVDRAIDLGSDRTLHEALSRRLRTELQHSTLFDTRGYARGIEAAYRNMAAGVPA